MVQQKRLESWEVLEHSIKNTPDWDELKKSHRDEFPVFITGSYRIGKSRSYRMFGANYYGVGVSWDNHFIVKNIVDEVDPLVFKFGQGTQWDKLNHIFEKNDLKCLEGDVFGIPLRRLADLDIEYGNGEGMKRELVWITLRSPENILKNVRCYVYTVDIEFFLEYFSYTPELTNAPFIAYENKFSPNQLAYKG